MTWEETFDRKFYEGEDNSTLCKEHGLFATPTELKAFIRTQKSLSVQETLDAVREKIERLEVGKPSYPGEEKVYDIKSAWLEETKQALLLSLTPSKE